MNKLFNIDWEKVDQYLYLNSPIHTYFHNEFGTVRFTDYAMFESGQIKENNYIIQSLLREYFLKNQELIICIENEKISYINYGNKTCKTFDDLIFEFPKNILDKQNRVLLNLARIQPNYGQLILSINEYDCFAKDAYEMHFFLNILSKKKYIHSGLRLSAGGTAHLQGGIKIEAKGWIEIEEIEKPGSSKQVFIAMWFDSRMDNSYISIERACKENGFDAFKINSKEHNNEISGEILSEIRKSRFLIADVTGQRQGVYFEAGYALALGLPVIWCCKKDDMDNVHFDTRQYNHVVWSDEEDLLKKLKDRIKGTIGS